MRITFALAILSLSLGSSGVLAAGDPGSSSRMETPKDPVLEKVAAATARRIPVTVIPPIVTEATADLHFGLLLAVEIGRAHV